MIHACDCGYCEQAREEGEPMTRALLVPFSRGSERGATWQLTSQDCDTLYGSAGFSARDVRPLLPVLQ